MGVLYNKVKSVFDKARLANALLTITITRNPLENSIDLSGDPETNENFGEIESQTAEEIEDVEVYLEPFPTGYRANGNYIRFEDTGYMTKDMEIARSMTELKQLDTFEHPNGYIYEIKQTNGYYEETEGIKQFVYCEATVVKKEYQGLG